MNIPNSINSINPEYLAESSTRTVFSIDDQVIKIPRIDEKLASQSYDDRSLWAFDYCIERKSNGQQIISSTDGIPIQTPEEHFMIAEGEDGKPVPIIIQERISGKTLKYEQEKLPENLTDPLFQLVKASRENYSRTGRFFDLIGSCTSKTEKNLGTYARKFWKTVGTSSNLLTDGENLILVDMDFAPEHNGLMKMAYFLAMEKEYYRLLLLSKSQKVFNQE